MKEYTFITTVEVTEIFFSDFAIDVEKYKDNLVEDLGDQFGFDKVEAKSCKVFPREVEDDA